MGKKKVDGLLFPKPVRKKKRMKHKASILDTEKGICYICDKLYGDRSYKYTEYHHIMFGGGKKTNSEELGLTVYLCREHHKEGRKAAHSSRETREYLCREAQEAFEREHTREEWVNMDFKDYLTKMPENVDFTKCGGHFEENRGKNDLKSARNVDFTKCEGHFKENGKNPMKNATNVENTKCDRHFGEAVESKVKTEGEQEHETEEEPNGAAGDFKVGEYIAYLWGETIEYGYILEIGEAETVWVGEEPDAWIRRMVEIPYILR